MCCNDECKEDDVMKMNCTIVHSPSGVIFLNYKIHNKRGFDKILTPVS